MSTLSRVKSQSPTTPALSFMPMQSGLLNEQQKLGPVKELNHQSQPLSIAPLLIQRKLSVGEPDDIYEKEADRVAAQVMQIPESQIQRRPALQINPAAKAIKGSDKDTDVPPVVQEVLRSPGQPRDAETRAYMESRFGHDFSQVRVHTGARAAESVGAVNALAYTVGRDVVFGTGQYEPGTSEGRMLLGHELTHVVQQNRQKQITQIQRMDSGVISDSGLCISVTKCLVWFL